MQKINIGDFILSKDGIWEIINIRLEGSENVYDLKLISQPADFLDVSENTEKDLDDVKYLKGASKAYISYLGKLVPKESEQAASILFED